MHERVLGLHVGNDRALAGAGPVIDTHGNVIKGG